MSNILKSLKLEYIAKEDRLRLVMLCRQEKVNSIWLTQRLLHRLLVPLFAWLEQKQSIASLPKGGAHNLRAAEHSIRVVKKPGGAVAQGINSENGIDNAEKMEAEKVILVTRLEAKGHTNGAMELIFETEEGQKYSAKMDFDQLKQWLRMLYLQCQRAQWCLGVQWPSILMDENALMKNSDARVLH